MRMWAVSPQVMCRKHLLGEHVEMHMFAGAIAKGKSIAGFIENGLVDTAKIAMRHDALAAEMKRRGYQHKSPLKQPNVGVYWSVDQAANVTELARRCEDCRRLMVSAKLIVDK